MSQGLTHAITVTVSMALSIGAALLLITLMEDPVEPPKPVAVDGADLKSDSTVADLLARVEALEVQLEEAAFEDDATTVMRNLNNRVQALERSIGELQQGRLPTQTARGSTAEMDAIVEEALQRMEEREQAEREEQETAEREEFSGKIVEWVTGQIRGMQDDLGITDAQIAEIEALTGRLSLEYMEAEAAGATEEELEALKRESARGVRDIMGPAMYRDYRVRQRTQEYGPKVGFVSMAVGADGNQREQLDTYMQAYVQRSTDQRIRLDTEEMPQEERERLEEDFKAAEEQAWEEGLNSYFTEEQRERLERMNNWGGRR